MYLCIRKVVCPGQKKLNALQSSSTGAKRGMKCGAFYVYGDLEKYTRI